MVTEADTRQLLDLERQFWDAIQQRDAAKIASLTAEDSIVVGAQGVTAIDRPTLAQMLTEGAWSLESYDLDEGSVQVLKPGSEHAVIAYRVTEQLLFEGRPLTLEAFDSTLWVRREGRWLCVLHTESIAGDGLGGAAA
jgi:hypothetical protein